MSENYERLEKLGQGTYGVVYKCKHKKTGEIVALKKIRVESLSDGIPATTLREMSILKEISRCPYIVRLEDVLLSMTEFFLVFEFCPFDLKKYIESFGPRKPSNMISMDVIKRLMYQLLEGIMYCHRRRIIHRDLKPQNILLSTDGTLRIADFGLARLFALPIKPLTHEIVTLWYRPPEVLLGSKLYGPPVDLWAVGCIFGELILRHPLFRGDSEIDQLFRIFRVLRTPDERIWPGVTELRDFKPMFPKWSEITLPTVIPRLHEDADALDIILGLLEYNPPTRLTAKKALQHPFFEKMDKTGLPEFVDELDFCSWSPEEGTVKK